MSTESEAAYIEGQRTIWRDMLETSLRGLGRDSTEWTTNRWVVEREETVALLRRICTEHGDNDWPDDGHLFDIIDKHLARYLDKR